MAVEFPFTVNEIAKVGPTQIEPAGDFLLLDGTGETPEFRNKLPYRPGSAPVALGGDIGSSEVLEPLDVVPMGAGGIAGQPFPPTCRGGREVILFARLPQGKRGVGIEQNVIENEPL